MQRSAGGRRLAQLALGIGVSAALGYFAVRGQDWSEIGTALSSANYAYIPLIVAVSLYTLFVRAQRWRSLLERATGGPIPVGPIWSATVIGFMSNIVLPLRAGEIVRPYLASRFASVSIGVAFASAVLERMLDMIAVLVLLMIVASTSGFEEPVKTVATYATVAGGIGIVAIFVIHAQKDRFLPVMDRLWSRLPAGASSRIVKLEHGFFDALASVAQTRVLLRLLAWSLYLWFGVALTFYLSAVAMGIEVGYLGGGIAVAGVVALAVALPSAPGFIGVWQAACIAALSLYGVPAAAAVAYSFFSHAMVFLSQVPIGLVYLAREGLSFAELGRARDAAPPGAERL